MKEHKPTKKPVDLSVLIKSGIDCEFWSGNESKNIHKLVYISNNGYKAKGRKWHNKCRPRMNHWHDWQGGECPLPEGFVVDVITRMDAILYNESTANKQYWRYDITTDCNQIISFRVVGLADGYCYPWEIEK